VEAISNGIPLSNGPNQECGTTLTFMALVMVILILGSGFLAYELNDILLDQKNPALRHGTPHIWSGIPYYVLQAATAAILVLAANTSLPTFLPCHLLAADRFLPRQLASRGDRLVFSNGVLILALLASALIMIFKGNEQAMLPLYALGVFISFTLSQAGMVSIGTFAPGGRSPSDASKKKRRYIVLRQPIQALPAMKPNDCKPSSVTQMATGSFPWLLTR